MTNALNDSAREPVRALIGRFREQEKHEAEQREESFRQLDEALQSINAWSERLEQWQAESEQHERKLEEQRCEAEQDRVEYEQECDLLRQRVHDLEKALQERTEELLRAQAANNALAALQTASIHRHSHEEEVETSESGQSVAERFENLRRQRAEAN